MSKWHPEELKILRTLMKRGRSYAVMTAALPRHTSRAIQQKVFLLGWAPRKRNRDGSREIPTVKDGRLTFKTLSAHQEAPAGRWGRARDRRDLRRAARTARC